MAERQQCLADVFGASCPLAPVGIPVVILGKQTASRL
jgi:hypothetical protein